MVSHSGVGLKDADNAAQKRHKGVFRPELEGLRAIGILAVMTYHAGIKVFPGSFAFIDLFFVISGFLITGLLVRELESTKRISLSGFYARRIRRLLPAATVVLVFTAILTWWFADPIDRPAFGIDIAAAATYVVNWVLAWRSVDYLAEDVGASPVQQLWSLAVEEQFYIVWPLVLIVVALIIRKYHRNARQTMAIGLFLIVIPSFVWSVVFTQQDAASAYFVTTTRLWELGVGGLIAVGASLWTKIPKTYARIIGWTGFVVVIASALFYTSALAWPGYLALAPVLGTAAIIIAGATGAAPALSETDTEPIWCTFGDATSKKRVVLAGDSKAMQWSETLAKIGSHQGWRLDTATKSRCPFVVDTVRYLNVTTNPYTACKDFNTTLMDQLLKDKPDAVILSQRASQAIAPDGKMTRDVMEEGMTKTWSTLLDNDIQVIPLLDNPGPILPAFDGQVYRCVGANPEDFAPCVFNAVPAIEKSGIPIMTDVAESLPGVDVVSMTDVFCDEKVCPPVIGNVLVYRQTTHITNTYALSTKSILRDRLSPTLPFESKIRASDKSSADCV